MESSGFAKIRQQRAKWPWALAMGVIGEGIQIGGANNYIIARSLFVLAGLLLLWDSLSRPYVIDLSGKPRPIRLLAVLIILVVCAFLFCMYLAPKPVRDSPHLQVDLVIDGGNGNDTDGHIDIENIGTVSVTVTKIYFATEKAANLNLISKAQTLSPKAKLSESLPLVVIESGNYSTLDLNVKYATDTERYLTEYHFFLAPSTIMAHAVIHPERFVELSGDLPDGNEAKLIAGFSSPQGTVFLVIDEVANGGPNKLTLSDGKKTLVFDPIRRIVYLTVVVNGGTITRKGGLDKNASRRHILTIQWTPDSGSLRVDGKDAL